MGEEIGSVFVNGDWHALLREGPGRYAIGGLGGTMDDTGLDRLAERVPVQWAGPRKAVEGPRSGVGKPPVNRSLTVLVAIVLAVLVLGVGAYKWIETDGIIRQGRIINEENVERARNGEFSSVSASPPAYGESVPSLADFEALRTGMTYAQVRSVLGSPGELVSSADIPMGEEYLTEMHQWECGDGPYAVVLCTFQGGELVAKAQTGLE